MTVSRADAITFLARRLGLIAPSVGVTNTDDGNGYSDVIDAALLALGTDYDDLATATVDVADGGKYRALLYYHGLQRLADAATVKYSVTIFGAIQANRSDIFKALAVRIAGALADLKTYGITPTGASVFRRVRIGLDVLEPVQTA